MADKRRRKSLSLFRQKIEHTPIITDLPSPVEKVTDEGQVSSPADIDQYSPKVRPRTLQKQNRNSVFGSWRSLQSLDEDEKAALTRSDSKASSLNEEQELAFKGLLGSQVLQYGEIQASGTGVFKKKNQFLVLTESHLIRFRNQFKASEMFPSIPSNLTRTQSSRMSFAGGSYHDLQMTAYTDITSGIPLEEVVAVYQIDEGRPFSTVEVSYLDERAGRASSAQLHVNDQTEAEQWISAIRNAAKKTRASSEKRVQSKTLETIARLLEHDRDYDPEHFQVFTVVKRVSAKSTGKSSAEDLTKLTSLICYLVIGLHKIHLIPLSRASTRSSTTSVNEIDAVQSFGLTTLTAIKLYPHGDAFQLHFKAPLRQPYVSLLASSQAGEVALWTRFACEYLRPEWIIQPFIFDVPRELDDQMNPPDFPLEDHNCFDRTLIAYCAAYDVDTSRICYTVDYDCEDAPRFQLLSPLRGNNYSVLELLAVFRALRYNEAFVTISFAGINLLPLRFIFDSIKTDTDGLTTRSGLLVNIQGHFELSMLGQEIRALGLKSRRLRRLDFSHTMPPQSHAGEERYSCGVLEALVPLCKKSLTNVDWIVLTGLQLADSDLDFLVDAASERTCHLRALDTGDCGLSVHDIDVLLNALAVQENTVEVINISGALGRFSPEIFQRAIGAFSRIRKLNLTRVQKTAGNEPLIPPEVLMTWRLEALYLSQTPLNEQTVDSISAYLASSKSDVLREVYVNQCGLTGRDLAVFLRSMTREIGQARHLHLSANENRLKIGSSMLFKTIAKSYGPSSLSLRMMDFEKEYHFRDLVTALTHNTTIRSLDISRATLPYDASTETCEALKEMLATNTSLVELDISGDHAHLDATHFGIGLNIALRGLEKNKTLKLLRIEYQNLGLQGANTLAGVLETNTSLLEIHCDHNEINLQSFTVLVNALEKNKTLLQMPLLESDRQHSVGKLKREVQAMENAEVAHTKGSIKRSFTGAIPSKIHRHGHRHSSSVSSVSSFTEQEVSAALKAFEEKWNAQVERMQKYLYRNYCLANGIPSGEEAVVDGYPQSRPQTTDSLATILGRVNFDGNSTSRKSSTGDLIDEKPSVDRSKPVFQLPED